MNVDKRIAVRLFAGGVVERCQNFFKMEGEGLSGAITRSKRRFNSDFDNLLPCDSADSDQPLPEIVTMNSSAASAVYDDRIFRKEHSHCGDVSEDILQMTNQNLEEKIKRLSNILRTMAMKLPDKGEKVRADLKAHEEERDRRTRNGLTKDGAGSRRQSCVTETSIRYSESNEPKKAAQPSQQQSQNKIQMEKDKDEVSRICDVFGPELRPSSRDDKTKKKQKVRSAAGKGTSKSSLPLRGNEDAVSRFKSLADINSRCQSEPRGNRPLLRSNKANAKEPVVLLDDEETEPEECAQNEADAALRETIIYYPSRDDPGSVEIRYEELKCLSPSMYLTSTIMNFYIRCLQGSSSSNNSNRTDYHFFNTYFYKKLQEAVQRKNAEGEAHFIKFRRWWKGVNIFEKAYIFLPIHEDVHWSLVIICFPVEADESGPVILHLDSLGYHYSRKIFNDIKRFLKDEWNFVKEKIGPPAVPIKDEIWQHLPSRIEEKIITVPQQNNDSDCGVFVLYFIERFIIEAPQRLRKEDLAMFGRKWFKPEEASKLRGKIKRFLMAKFRNSKGIFEPLTETSGSGHSSSGSEGHLVS